MSVVNWFPRLSEETVGFVDVGGVSVVGGVVVHGSVRTMVILDVSVVVFDVASNVSVIDTAAFADVGVFGVEVRKLDRNEDEGSKERGRVALAHAVSAMYGVSVGASNFGVSVKFGV